MHQKLYEMRLQIIYFLFLILISSCYSPEETVVDFYDALNNVDGKNVKQLTSEKIQIIIEGKVVCRNQEELYNGFQCDSVLGARYEILEILMQDSLVEVTLSKSSQKLQFLHDTAIVYKAKIKLTDNRIAEIEVYDYLLLEFKKVYARQDSLVSWINKNHPELSGFESGESIKNAQNYLKAIELFNNKN